MAIGGCTVAELQERMSASEFAEWMAYERIDPWGLDRGDLRTAAMTAAIINTVRGLVSSNAKTVRIDEVMLRFDQKPTVDEDAATEAAMALLTRIEGGIVHG